LNEIAAGGILAATCAAPARHRALRTPEKARMVVECRVRQAAVLVLALAALLHGPAWAAPGPEQETYWWMDELRAAAFALGEARTGKVSCWPNLAIPAGSALLPLPPAAGPVTVDGTLDEPAWQKATTFPVGPVFGPWRDGPVVLQVSACRDEKAVYLAIESPRDLSDLGSLGAAGELFTAGGRPYRVGALPEGTAKTDGRGRVIELALAPPKPGEPLVLAFAAEVVCLAGNQPPPEFTSLGLTGLRDPQGSFHRHGSLWLSPIQVSLAPADAAARLAVQVEGREVRLSHQLAGPGKDPQAGVIPLAMRGTSGVYRYDWRAKADAAEFRLEGFAYVEPVTAVLRAARDIAHRQAARRGTPEAVAPLIQEIADLERQAQETAPGHRETWRPLYCRARHLQARAHLGLLDAPLVFVKQHPYFAAHIYDDYYTWHPGGGIYMVENPAEDFPQRRVRAIIDPRTTPTLGAGVYRNPELSWDARRIVFAYKPAADAMTSLYEIGLDGRGLRRLTQSDTYHDVGPAYLPDGRIVFTSTRPRGRVPCFNSGVDTLHTMDPDGSHILSISSNNVTEFDPSVMPDGRILYGRWEYVDKTALYMQSLWTVFPDGTNETALFANNLARPTALLDARPVPGTDMVVASLTPHNGQAVGAVGMIDPALGKNNLAAITNFTPEYPVEMDQGLTVGPSDPWPLSKDDVLVSNNAVGAHGIVEMIDRFGRRELVQCDAAISCAGPMPVRPRTVPPTIASSRAQAERPGRFLILDVYQGLAGVKRGEVKRLRVLEETARTSEVPPGGRWWNQAFLISWQGAYVVKNYLGTVPVEPDGSAYFEAPPGRALYLEAMDADGREVHRMRTFVQAVPGVTRSCIGCHEHKMTAPAGAVPAPAAARRPPSRPEPESWGTGFVDYPTMIQPILDRRCVSCHGGEKDIAGGHDLSGGWTWAFNLSYETLLKNNLVGFIRCLNEDTTSSDILPPRKIGSGAAPLGQVLVDGHQGRIPDLTRPERDLLMAWMDGNSSYYGTWDYTPQATCNAILSAGGALAAEMKAAGCTRCHAPGHVGNDWINLRNPEWSRILRAPLAKADKGLGLAWCRERKAAAGLPLVTQSHLPADVFRPPTWPRRDPAGPPHAPFASTDDARYQAMLKIIRQARAEALAAARVDMPGAQVVAGQCRLQAPMPLPERLPALAAAVGGDGAVELSWPRSAETIGLEFEVHRGAEPDFAPTEKTRLARSSGFRFTDVLAPAGEQHYALVACSGPTCSTPTRAALRVPQPPPPPPPTGVAAAPEPGQVALEWQPSAQDGVRYHVYRAEAGSQDFRRITREPLGGTALLDNDLAIGTPHAYAVRSVSRRGIESEPTAPVVAAAMPETREPVFVAAFEQDLQARLADGTAVAPSALGGAAVTDKSLDLGRGGHVTFAHRREFDLTHRLSVELCVRFDEAGTMPVVVSCGIWNGTGWFLQRLGGAWRWSVGGVDCDGGSPAVGRWIHLVATFDGRRARLFQDGAEVASVDCRPDLSPWPGPLFIGQYGASPSPQYQVNGRIRDLNIYGRAVPAREVADMAKAAAP
jgi:hypothetical protein